MKHPMIYIPGNSLVVVIGRERYSAHATHPRFSEIVNKAKNELWNEMIDLIRPDHLIVRESCGRIEIVDGEVLFQGKVIHNTLTTRILVMLREGFNVTPMCAFLDNLMDNPSFRAVSELYDFLEKGQLPITPDGHFVAYKKVRDNYMDFYTGKMDNSVGNIVEMPRNAVNEDKDKTCSSGLHFCSYEYLSMMGTGRVIAVKINPRDVVAIPSDYNNTKGRCCRYEVIDELVVAQQLPSTVYDPNQELDLEHDSEFDGNDEEDDIIALGGAIQGELDVGSSVATQDYISGYKQGYKAGHNKSPSVPGSSSVHFNHGLELGYKHGKAHGPKLYK